MIKFSRHSSYFFIFLFALLAILSYFIIKPFLTVIVTSLLVSFVFYPLYKRLTKHVKNENAAALLLTVIIFFIITVPLYFMISSVSNEAGIVYTSIKDKYVHGDFFPQKCNIDNFVCRTSSKIETFLKDPQVKYYTSTALDKFTSLLTTGATGFIFTLPKRLLDLFIFFFLTFFFLRDGKYILQRLNTIMPLKSAHKTHIYKKFYDVTYAIIYGQVIISILQGALAIIGFYFMGISNAVLLGMLVFVLGLLPVLGSSLIWAPLGVYYLFTGYVSQQNSIVIKGIVVLVYGFFVIAGVDTLLKPKIVGDRARVHPVLILLGVLGGLVFFGPIGLIIGPIMLAILFTFIKLYEEQKEKG